MRLRLLSRGSDLAVLQARMVAAALQRAASSLQIDLLTRSSEGDRDRRVALWQAADKGLFTTDLSHALISGEADLAVHSWKDLPIEHYPGTCVAGTLERADPRDVLLVRREAIARRPRALTILSSSPRRSWQLSESLAALLPWPIGGIEATPVRGNIPTRVKKLVAGDGDALVVAKAALDRLLSTGGSAAEAVRTGLAACRWMVLPLKECPTAPAQGALAIEVAAARQDVLDLVSAVNDAPTWTAVTSEREILKAFGGGCHEAVGATVLERDYGRVTSVRARMAGASDREVWSLDRRGEAPAPVPASLLWPRPEERNGATRRPLDARPPAEADGIWIARADAAPAGWMPSEAQVIWASGSRTWRKLAARGIWVHGCADGLGDGEAPRADALAGHAIQWTRVTHSGTGDPDAVATYAVDERLPDDLPHRRSFFWTSGSAFLQALERYPAIRQYAHASGPGRTSRVIRETLGPDARPTVWLDYEQWHQALTS